MSRGRGAPWRACGALFAVLCSLGTAAAQTPPTDAALRDASGARTVAVGHVGTRQVTAVPLEIYVARVLAGEAEPNAPPGALEAHAVAIRTFAVANMGRHRRDGFDLCDSTHCQVVRASTPGTRLAAHATAGRVLTYEGAIVEVVYSASCGGRSENASAIWSGRSVPYLTSVVDDVHDDDVPWRLTLPLDDIRRQLVRHGFTGARLTGLDVESRTASDRVARLRVPGLRPDVVSGEQFRAILGPTVVRSTAFSVIEHGSAVDLVGRGYGHGVGMCVIGAGRRARRGEDASAILSFYYPGLVQQPLGGLSGRPVAQPLPSAGDVPARVATALAPRPVAVNVRGSASPVTAIDLEQMATRLHGALSVQLGTSVPGVTVELHTTMEAYRAATRRPWWESSAIRGTTIDLAPATVLAQREGLEFALRQAMAQVFVTEALAARPAWVRVGAARYFARDRAPDAAVPSRRVRCPADAELEASVSASAFRDAEARAEACFAAAVTKAGDWRAVP